MPKLFFIFILLVSVSSFAQEKLEGIGPFKIEKTTVANLNSIAKEQKFDRGVIRTRDDYRKIWYKRNKLVEVVPDTFDIDKSPSYANYCKNARVFYIPKMKISGIDFQEIYLTFYNNILIRIDTEHSIEITEAFDNRFGKATIERKETESKCFSKLEGKEINYLDIFYYQRWKNESITCTATIGSYIGFNCEKTPLSFISITGDYNKVDELNNCNEDEERRLEYKRDTEEINKRN